MANNNGRYVFSITINGEHSKFRGVKADSFDEAVEKLQKKIDSDFPFTVKDNYGIEVNFIYKPELKGYKIFNDEENFGTVFSTDLCNAMFKATQEHPELRKHEKVSIEEI
jgi:hypothetical protein